MKDTRYDLLLVIANRATPALSWTQPGPPEPAAAPSSTPKGTGMEGAADVMGILVNEKELVLIVTRTTRKTQLCRPSCRGQAPRRS